MEKSKDSALSTDETNNEKPDHQFYNFPFLQCEKPRNLFCQFMSLDYLNYILIVKCMADEAKTLNDMSSEAAWQHADRSYFYPWVMERVKNFGEYKKNIEDGQDTRMIEDPEKYLTDINNKLDTVMDELQQISTNTKVVKPIVNSIGQTSSPTLKDLKKMSTETGIKPAFTFNMA